MHAASLRIYPVKGVSAVHCDAARVTARGLAHDRRWLVTDEDNRFITQRECSALARLSVEASDAGIRINNGGDSFEARAPTNGERRDVLIWKDTVNAVFAGDETAQALSLMLGRPARLFHMDDDAVRMTSGRWGEASEVSFADGYPVLVITRASLDALNETIAADGDAPVPIERFRPNIIVEGAEPWADDNWRVIRVGDVTFDLVKPCARCVVTTIDQASGDKTGRQPLKALRKIRQSAHPDVNGVLFGWNAVPRGPGTIKTGDKVEIVEERPEGWPLVRD